MKMREKRNFSMPKWFLASNEFKYLTSVKNIVKYNVINWICKIHGISLITIWYKRYLLQVPLKDIFFSQVISLTLQTRIYIYIYIYICIYIFFLARGLDFSLHTKPSNLEFLTKIRFMLGSKCLWHSVRSIRRLHILPTCF